MAEVVRIMSEKFERVLIPYFGRDPPEKAEQEAFKNLEKGGKLFLLHILDEAPTRSIRYRTGQMGENSEIIKTFKETQERVQKKVAEEYAEEAKERAAKHGISIEPLYTAGNPGEEVLEAIDEHSIELVIIEKLRERIVEIFLGKEIDYLCDEAPCEVKTID